MRTTRIGLLGCGTVGRGFVELVSRERNRIRVRHGVDLEIVRILVRDFEQERAGIDRRLLTTRAIDVLDDDNCDLVVELIGGVASAGAYVRRAIRNGKHVVTANKALLAECGRELFTDAMRSEVSIGFEASVCGGIPVIRALQRGLAGDRVERITGILNGTCNYVLTRMEEDGLDFDDALRLAQVHGFAEADATLDVTGQDASQKLRILGELAFDDQPVRISVEGIENVSRRDVEQAHAAGRVIRQIAVAEENAFGLELRVGPRSIIREDALAQVRDENNAVIIRGRAVGDITLIGRGAGSMPTAAAVLSDVIELAGMSLSRSKRMLAAAAS